MCSFARMGGSRPCRNLLPTQPEFPHPAHAAWAKMEEPMTYTDLALIVSAVAQLVVAVVAVVGIIRSEP